MICNIIDIDIDIINDVFIIIENFFVNIISLSNNCADTLPKSMLTKGFAARLERAHS